jgi:protein subunit release factor B
MLADALVERLPVTVSRDERSGRRDAPGRVLLQLDDRQEPVTAFVGTHLLLAELRGPRSRRRWFADVELEVPVVRSPLAFARRELEIRFVRSRGPGGQNVNKRDTAVQITHRPTGITAACDRHRSQSRNRAEALENLRRGLLRQLHTAREEQRRTEAWRTRRALTTRTPVMCWRLDPARPGTVVPI